MKRYFYYGVLLAIILLISASCSSIFSSLKNRPSANNQGKYGQAIAATMPSGISFPELASNAQPNPFIRFVDQNHHILLALAALFWLWFLIRIYEIDRGRNRHRLNMDDLALLKIIKDNATRIWNAHGPGKKIISLEDWKE